MLARVAGVLVTALVGASACAAPTDLDWRWDADGMLFPAFVGGGWLRTMLLQPDGYLLVGVESDARSYISRYDLVGQLDPAFGAGGRVEGPPSPNVSWRYVLAGMELGRDGLLESQWYHSHQELPSLSECWRVWMRSLPSGAPDPAAGAGGIITPQFSASRSCGLGDRLDSLGVHYRVDYVYVPAVPSATHTWIEVAAPDGARLPSLQSFDPDRWLYSSLSVDSLDRLVVGLRERNASDRGFAVGRTGSSVFGTGGVAFMSLPGSPMLDGARGFPGGGVVAYGSISGLQQPGVRDAVIVRFTEDGIPDATFGEGGATVIRFEGLSGYGVTRVGTAALADGRLLVLAQMEGQVDAYRSFTHVRMARLMPDGSLDTRFAEKGIAPIGTNGPAYLVDGPLIRPSGEFLVASSNVIFQFRGGDLAVPYPPVQRTAVEYYHAGYGHYFVTADVLEIATLDASPASGWARTGLSFGVYGSGDRGLVPVCRFWSGQSFAPKSSHFYTPYADECAKVKQDPAWQFERNAFHLRMPEGASGAATCNAGTQPLFRAYNDGQGGAPNHRYTTDPAVLDAMIAKGWIMEGEAATRVFACVPAPE